MRDVAAETVTEWRVRRGWEVLVPRCAGMLVREFLELGQLQGFFLYNFLIGRILESAALFYYRDFAPRCAERVAALGRFVVAGIDGHKSNGRFRFDLR
jgi:hypothetical protein